MSKMIELQNWYLSQCNEDWEHCYGIKIETLDNPGWSVSIELSDTYLEDIKYPEFCYGMGVDADTSGNEWLDSKVESNTFKGYGGPHKLEEIITVFLAWAKSNA
ncbi:MULTISPECIES: immunity 53 family protein [unclassified Moritella]|uniref:immunity 53 family protein n=1 Tax=unclassified Moritella TaxID=2637987 RepID=UPI001BA6164F|nr:MULTISPECIES: immunity 53 family protein [unclassified Moritella]QUM84894.1 immunity 53 family protein [Moritella sp. 28]QUM89136.1 immunity 53 family protein [Moritella sp. 36]